MSAVITAIDGPGLGLGQLFFGVTLLVASILMAIATAAGVVSGSAVINYLLACLGLFAALLQGWGMLPLALNARGRARESNVSDWNIIRSAKCTRGPDQIWAAGPGWILFEEKSARFEVVASRFSFRSRSRTAAVIRSDRVVGGEIVQPFKGSYPRTVLNMEDGSTVEIDLSPNSGSTVWGVKRERMIEIVQKLTD